MNQLEGLALILGTLQGLQTAWLHYQMNKNACGGAKCVETMTKALRITVSRVERTPGAVAVNKVAQSSETNSVPFQSSEDAQ